MTNRVLTDADLEEFTPAEIEALRGGATATDDEPEPAQEDEVADPAAAAQSKEPAAAETGEDPPADDKPADDVAQPGKTDPGADADTLADVLAEAQPSDARRYELPDTASITDQRKALREQRAALDAKWIAGAITDAERSEKVDAIDDQLDDLLMQATRANTLADVNRQNAINDQVRVIDSIRRDGAKVGIDYKPDGDAAGQFDTALQVLAVRKDMAGKPFEDIAREAHRVVLALNGKLAAAPPSVAAAAAPAPAPAAAPAPKPARDIPPTLGHMPAAARAPIANDFMSEFAGIDDPDRAEAMLESMPARQREALMRSTVKVQ
jgi:hypothetical protein